MKMRVLILFITVGLLCPLLGRASYMFKHYGIESGLSQSTGYAIVQDRMGFIWVGTKDGLNRYDGTSFKVYHAQNGGHSLGNDCISALYEDGQGNLWVGTDAGVWIYHPQTDTFERFAMRSGDGTVVSSTVNVITGRDNKIYVAANGQGVFCYDLRSRHLDHHRLQGFPNVASMAISPKGSLWLGFFRGGLYQTDDSFRSLTPFVSHDGKLPFAGDIVSSLCLDAHDVLFVGAYDNGLVQVDIRQQMVKPIVAAYEGKKIFVRNVALCGNEVWAASEQGLYLYDRRSHSLQHFMYHASDPFSLSDNPLYSLCMDREGGMWIGSYFGGVNYLPSRTRAFERFVPQGSGVVADLHGRRIREMVQDANGYIWIGTEDAGLNRFDPKTGAFAYVGQSMAFPNVHGLCMDGKYLWVGTFSYGVKLLDTQTMRVVKSYTSGSAMGNLRDNSIFSICKSPWGEIYLGTIRGLCRFDAKRQCFIYIKGVPPVLVNDVRFDARGNLWVATHTDGVYLYKRDSQRWTHFSENNHSGLTSNKVLSVFEDGEGQIWLSTQGGGVCRYDASAGKMHRFVVDGNKIGSTVFQILEDRQGVLWFTTYNGLVSYQPNGHIVRTYSNGSLMLDNQFNYRSSLLAADGEVYLGSLSGFVRFTPDRLLRQESKAKLVATSLRIAGEEASTVGEGAVLNGNIVFAKHFTLSYQQNSFSLKVAPLEYSSSVSLAMEYLLEGYDKRWQPVRADHIIAFSNLPAGTYRLRVRAMAESGAANVPEYSIMITIKPHVLFSSWAKTAYLLLALLMVGLVLRFLNKRSLRRRRMAMARLERKKEQELYESKIRFFTQVAHEIRTPLTLIKVPLENIIESHVVTDKEVSEDLDIMRQNTDRLSDLINQLLDFRKAEREGMRLNFESCCINDLVLGVYERFRSLMRKRHVQASISMPDNKLYASIDKEGFIKIVSNLLDNAMKYCASCVSLTLTVDGKYFSVEVSNDGDLVPENMREKIFEPFFRMEENKSLLVPTLGTGIGLALARSLAELHGGSVCMEAHEHLNVFRLTLPIKQDASVSLTAADEERDLENGDTTHDKKFTLLLVEDNVQLLDYEKRQLQKTYNVLTAHDGEEALRMMDEHTVHLVVSDIMMEPMNGMELLKRIKSDANRSFVPVILLTAVTSETAQIEGMENGADAYVVKPFSMSYLSDTIERILRQREEVKKSYATAPFVSSESVSISTADTKFLHQLNEVVHRHIDDSEFNVDQLAAELGMSRTSLNRKIRGTLDVSPNNYIRIERLKVAAQLLKEGEGKVNEVCYRVGFSSPSYFSKCFYQQFGLLPKDFGKDIK